MKGVENLLSVVFKSAPADLKEFIKWVAEVRRQEDGSMILSEEEKARLVMKVFSSFFLFLLPSPLPSPFPMSLFLFFPLEHGEFSCHFSDFLLFLIIYFIDKQLM